MNGAIAAALGIFLGTFGQSYAQGYYPHYIYGPDHEYRRDGPS